MSIVIEAGNFARIERTKRRARIRLGYGNARNRAERLQSESVRAKMSLESGVLRFRSRVLVMKIFLTKAWVTLATCAVLSGLSFAAMPQEAQIQVDRGGIGNGVTVKYKGRTIALMELRVNGRSMGTRDLGARAESGEASFTIDLETLVEGENTIEVRLFDKDGKLIGAEQTKVTVDKVFDGPVKLENLRNGQTVQGFVDLKLGFKRDLGNVYVSFFINGEFKSLRNTPPYNFLWDTQTQPNGWYELEAWVVDDRNQTMKTNKLRVFVNNPGGRTNRVTNPPTPPNSTPQASPTQPATAPTAQPASKTVSAPAVKPPAKPAVKPVVKPVTPTKVQSTPAPQGQPKATTTPPSRPTPRIPAENRTIKPVVAPVAAPAPVNPPVNLDPSVAPISGKVTAPVGTKALAPAAGIATGQRNLTPTGSRVVAPKAPPVAPRTVAKVGPQVKPNLSTLTAPSATLPLVAVQRGTKLPNLANMTILLNNQIVNFDVAPRVTEGVPLTPFRHLFEHAGGKVDWEQFEKVMTANGLGKEIWVKIGDRVARVNGKEFTLEIVPFLERGRTIVPLSFVKDSLDVDVQFDPNTGHVLITAKPKN